MGLFWQVLVFLIVAAALGFVIGWVARAARFQHERAGAVPRQTGGAAALADERDRLGTELRAAREAQAEAEGSLVELRQLAEARAGRVYELEQAEARSRERIVRLEQELSEASEAGRAPGETDLMATPPEAPPAAASAAPPSLEPLEGRPPPALATPEGEPDDLKKISGIGPGIEKTLHELGIYHFRQIAAFTPDNVAWIDQRLRFKGRIERENWIDQARKLAAGETLDQT